MNFLKAFILFSRPHTIIGTTTSVFGLYLIAFVYSSDGSLYLSQLLLALISCLAANIYIVGLNQVTDIEIDKINKPELPLASGAYSLKQGQTIIISFLILALVIAYSQGIYLFITVLTSIVIGTAYSLPPVRLKRFHFWAAFCIFSVRGLLVNVFLFLHFNSFWTEDPYLPAHIWALTIFMFGISLVIAWFKDIPDMSGDSRFNILTLTLKLGAKNVFNIGIFLLTLCYLGFIVAGFIGLPGVDSSVLIISHILLLTVTLIKARRIKPEEKTSITNFYMFLWGLFYSEYIFFTAACLFV